MKNRLYTTTTSRHSSQQHSSCHAAFSLQAGCGEFYKQNRQTQIDPTSRPKNLNQRTYQTAGTRICSLAI
ncbi:MAG: hypothetical protein ACQCN6_02175 [Candidatus Bathyarchaeia archaeon]